MKFLSKKEVQAICLYSFAHIDRLEKAGKFPKRIRLAQIRVGWLEDEVYEWMQALVDKRNDASV